MKNFLLLIFCSIFLFACGAGSGEGLDENGKLPGTPEPEPPGNGGNNPDGVSLQDLVSQIFDNSDLGAQRCTNCHSGSSPLGGMNLQTVELAYANLVGANGEGITANGNANFKRVLPGDPDASYIILKLEGDTRAGNQMPLNETPLTPAQVDMVRDWIANGAPASGTGTSATVISKVSTPSNTDLHLRFSRTLSPEQHIDDALEIYFVENGAPWLAPRDFYSANLFEQNLHLKFAFPEVELEGYTLKINTLLDSRHTAVDGNKNKQEGGEFIYEYRF